MIYRIEEGRGHFSSFCKVMAVLSPSMKPASAGRRRYMSTEGVVDDSRFTPPDFLKLVRRVSGRAIDLDPCGHADAYVKAKRTYSREDDGLTLPWRGPTVFCNPPFRLLPEFLRRAHRAYIEGEAQTIVMLCPSRVYAKVWSQTTACGDVFLLKDRMKFFDKDGPLPYKVTFGLAVLIWTVDRSVVKRARETFEAHHVRRISKL